MNTENSTGNFEDALKEYATKKTHALYAKENFGRSCNHNTEEIKAKDLLKYISNQIEALQGADRVNNIIVKEKHVCKSTKSNVLSDNDKTQHSKPSTSKFDTQFATDTQLINIIKDTEAIIEAQCGMTQEFETTFTDNLSKDVYIINKNTKMDTAEEKCNKSGLAGVEKTRSQKISPIISAHNLNMKIRNDIIEGHDRISKSSEFEDFVKSDSINTEDDEEKQRLSPIINIIKPIVHQIQSPVPLIYNLESFENFESIALPVIEKHADLHQAKIIINSQIVNRELFLPNNIIDRPTSPILSNNSTPKQTEYHTYNKKSNKNNTNFVKNVDDDILFSSDEENYKRDLDELPLTCALHTSFYNQSDVLDTTMYVGFQTASNKPIQVLSDSFIKAKSMLNNVNKNENTALTFTDLVNSYDINFKVRDITQRTNNDKAMFLNIANEDLVQLSKQSLPKTEAKLEELDNLQESKPVSVTTQVDNECYLNQSTGKIFDKLKAHSNGKNNAIDNLSLKYIDLIDNLMKEFENNHMYVDKMSIEKAKNYSDESVEQSANTLKPSNNNNNYGIEINNATSEKKNLKFTGFKTANNKDIPISKQALEKTKKIFCEIEMNEVPFKKKTRQSDIQTNGSAKEINETSEVNDTVLGCEIIDVNETMLNKIIGSEKIFGKSKQNLRHIDKENYNGNQLMQYVNNLEMEIFKTNDAENEEISKEVLTRKQFNKGTGFHTNFKKQDSVPKFARTGYSEFQTSSNKNMRISDNAFLQSKMLFDDLNFDSDDNLDSKSIVSKQDDFKDIQITKSKKVKLSKAKECENKRSLEILDINNTKINTMPTPTGNRNCTLKGFQTASNKEIKISNEALIRSENVFRDISYNNNMINEKDLASNRGDNTNFQTDGNNISENTQTLDSKKLLEDIDFSDEILEQDKVTKNSHKELKIASNKKINTLHEGLSQSETLLEDHNNTQETKKSFPVIDASNTFKGFLTANNKKIKISEQALLRTKKIFEDINLNNELKESKETDISIDFKVNNEKYIIARDNFKEQMSKDVGLIDEMEYKIVSRFTDKNNTFEGFQTANNKMIKISGQALLRTKKIFENIDFNNDLVEHKQELPRTDSGGKFIRFHTASNKEIKVSEKALFKSKKIFEDFDNDDNIQGDKMSEQLTDERRTFKGFQTASNKNVKVSEQALSRTRKIFENIDFNNDNCENKNSNSYKDFSNNFKGFKTASNKNVIISEESILKSKKLFQDIDNNWERENNKTNGIQKHLNNKAQLPEEIFLNSKEISADIDFEVNDQEDNNSDNHSITSKSFKGFQTASNKKVNVSKEALLKSVELFKELECTQNNYKRKGSVDEFEDANLRISNNKKSKLESIPGVAYFENKSNDITNDLDNLDLNKDMKTNKSLGFKTGNNEEDKISENSLVKSNEHPKTRLSYLGNDLKSENIENMINTEVLINFQETLHTEDFLKGSTPKCKRSGSPILSCPKGKKKKTKVTIDKDQFHDDAFIFNENYKKNKIYTLKQVLQIEKQAAQTIKDPYILQFDFDTILNVEFFEQRNDVSVDRWTTDKIKQYFLESVNKKIVPTGWVENHMKLIIWKLVTYEKTYPNCMKNVCTVRNVMEQLKYRYTRELYNVERPALRKILEKDIDSSRTIVLMVVKVISTSVIVDGVLNATQNIELQLTDGWYCVTASLDTMLARLVCDGKIHVGTKLVTHGAELMNCDQGIGPLEDISLVRLKLFGNSTRRAKFDSRLGFHGNGAILSRLSAVSVDGGKISRLKLLITRVYPMLYVERFSDGSTVTRSERLENLYQMKFETEHQGLLEKIYEEVENELLKQESQDSSIGDPDKMESGSQIWHFLKTSKDPAEHQAHLSNTQRNLLLEYSAKRRDRLLNDLQAKVRDRLAQRGLNLTRNVVPLLKIRVVDPDDRNIGKAMLTIWRPDESLVELIAEGACVDVYNVVPTGVRYSELQISAGRQSLFQKSSKMNEKISVIANSLKRKCYTVQELAQNPTITTDYNEIDTFGFIFLIEPSTKEFETTRQLFQNVYLTDADKNMICVNFWGGIAKFGFGNVLDTGQIVTCVNLQKRSGNTRKNIPHYRATEYSYFTKTSKVESVRKMADSLSQVFATLDRRKFIEDCVALKNNFNIKYGNTNSSNLSKNINSPANCNLDLTGLDFESPFEQDTGDAERLLRKKQVEERIAKLKRYGEPPPLSSIHIINKCKKAALPFKSPLISNNSAAQQNCDKNSDLDSKISVAIKENSPIICRKNVSHSNSQKLKRNICPVKLDFNQKDISQEDPFAEDIDGSPPLSLD